MNREDIVFKEEGLVIHLTSSKTDQEGKGRQIGIAYGSSPESCPVRALKRWIERAEIQEGPLFRSISRHGRLKEKRLQGQAINYMVKKHIKSIGKDPDRYGAHSLRSGLVTQSAINGVGMLSIMEQTGHQSEEIVREYYKPATLFENNASTELGL